MRVSNIGGVGEQDFCSDSKFEEGAEEASDQYCTFSYITSVHFFIYKCLNKKHADLLSLKN